ncbi:MAG: terminase family protein [Pseudomonadota bacterium]
MSIPPTDSTGDDPPLDWSHWAVSISQGHPFLKQVPFLASARDSQRPPPGDWRNWLFLGGRGSGKTRAGAEWLCFAARFGGVGRLALVGSSLAEVRDVMIEGPSGIRAVALPPGESLLTYEVTRRRIVFPNGAEVFAFSAGEPESLRGPQFGAAWCDELAAWPEEGMAWDMMQLGLRLGEHPRAVATTTPKPSKLIKRLVDEKVTAVTRSTTAENASNLAPGFLDVMRSQYGHGALAQQELDGLIVEPTEGALWSFDTIERNRVYGSPETFENIIVGIDPPVSASATADACGLVAAGRASVAGFPAKCFVLADASARGLRPLDWAARAVALAEDVGATGIVAEANQGGEMVREVLKMAGATMQIKLVHARLDKRGRALPVSAMYARDQVSHVGQFDDLERELLSFGTTAQNRSPDRMDALVWAVWALMIDGAIVPKPQMRRL